jgi:hypothetical protein
MNGNDEELALADLEDERMMFVEILRARRRADGRRNPPPRRHC